MKTMRMKCAHAGCARDAYRGGLCSTHYIDLSRRPADEVARSWEEGARSARLHREQKERCLAAMRRAGGAE